MTGTGLLLKQSVLETFTVYFRIKKTHLKSGAILVLILLGISDIDLASSTDCGKQVYHAIIYCCSTNFSLM